VIHRVSEKILSEADETQVRVGITPIIGWLFSAAYTLIAFVLGYIYQDSREMSRITTNQNLVIERNKAQDEMIRDAIRERIDRDNRIEAKIDAVSKDLNKHNLETLQEELAKARRH
jgi:hypothetical protein